MAIIQAHLYLNYQNANITKHVTWLFRSDGATCFGQTVPL